MRLATLVYRNVARRPIRSALTVSGMAIAVAAVVALVGVADGFKRSFLDLYQGHGIDIVVVRARVADRMTSELDQSLGQTIRAVDGVASVEPVLLDVVSLDELGPVGVVVQGLEPTGRMASDGQLVAGRRLTADGKRAVMLGRILAANLGKQVGDEVEIYEDEKFQVVGIYDRNNIFENGAMIVPLAALQRLLDQQGQVTAFNVTVDRTRGPAVIPRVVDAIQSRAAGVSAMATENYVATDTKIQIATAMAWSTSAMALVIGAIGMLNTMIISVFERTSEIGILRAIGWRRGRIVRMILMESSLLAIIGGAIGTLVALGMTYALSRAPATSGLVDSRVAPSVIAQGILIALAIGIVGAIYPAARAARLPPTVALREQG